MPQFRIAVTADLVCSEPIDVTRLKLASRAKSVSLLSLSMVQVVFIRRGPDAVTAAEEAVQDLRRALPPEVHFRRPPVWKARERRRVGGARVTGRSRLGGPDDDNGDDGLGGVREPRRPMPPTGSASLALELPDS